MIIVKIQGGLANQMFQYAFGRTLSRKWRQPLYLDLGFYGYQDFRKFELDKFPGLSYKTAGEVRPEKLKVIRDDFHYKNRMILFWKDYYFDGYWQTEKYFSQYRDLLLEEFVMPGTMAAELKQKYTSVLSKKTISIHVRRTDYLTAKDNYHPVQPVSYFEKALKQIPANETYQVLIFSDDIGWCKENFRFANQHFIEGNSNLEDLFLMSWCDHNIIANSSFSWWAAWLNRNPGKKVIAPRQWFGESAGLSTEDLIPSDWTRI